MLPKKFLTLIESQDLLGKQNRTSEEKRTTVEDEQISPYSNLSFKTPLPPSPENDPKDTFCHSCQLRFHDG